MICVADQINNFILMSLYRMQRTHTHRHRAGLQNNINSEANNHREGPGNDMHLPVGYYFNAGEKTSIIKNMIDAYFEGGINPERIRKQTAETVGKILNNKSCMPYSQRSCSKEKIDRIKESDIVKFKTLSKTADVKFFSHRSAMEQNQSDLPIISEMEDGEVRRPQSEQKSRYISSPKVLRRRQSAGLGYLRDSFQNSQVETTSINSGSALEQNESLSQSFVLSNMASILSKGTRTSSNSYANQLKYYNFHYSKHKVVKRFNPEGLFLLERQVKLKRYGAETLWGSPSLPHELVLQPHQPLSKQLYQKVSKKHGEETIHILFPHEAVYWSLFANNCEWLRDIITGMCSQLISISNKIIVNKITVDNICRVGEKKMRVIDWSGAAIRESVTNVDKVSLVKITEPTLKQKPSESAMQVVKWVCSPQYLAPEVVQLLQTGDLDDEKLWQCPSASDTWSIGCLILEILTLIPLNAETRYKVKGRQSCRRGLLRPSLFSFIQLERRQKLLATQSLRVIRKQCADFIAKVDTRILSVMQRMLAYDKSARIKPEEAIQILK